MVVESFPPLAMRDVDLEEVGAAPRLRGKKLPTLMERLAFGGPELVQITSDYHPDDADLQAFIRGAQQRWVLAHLALTFPPREGPPLKSATVQVNLDDDGDPPATIAFSILPVVEATPYEETETFTVSPNVTIGSAVGISLGSIGRQRVIHREAAFLLGGPELSPRPAWHFTPTLAQELVGSTRLSMILRVPNGRSAKISIDLSAEVLDGPRFRRRQVPLQPEGTAEGHFEATF
jgi:hypothetical protein